MGRIISIANHKGGVGKTTTALNLGAGLHQLGEKILLIDLDPQASLTTSLGVDGRAINIYRVIKNNIPPRTVEIHRGLNIIPSSLDLSGAELELSDTAGREYILRENLKLIQGQYSYIIID